MKLKLTALFLLTALSAFALEGKVVSIADGDTLTILTADNEQIKVRLSGIDTPEKNQAFGTKAKQALSAKVFGKTVRVQDNGQDRYKRTLGDIFLGERWINYELVEDGYAWHYKAYSKDIRLAQAEVEARAAKRGLWAETNPIPPWEFRNPKKSNKAITGYWLNESSGVRHNSNCQHYKNTKRGKSCSKSAGRPGGCCGG